MNPSPDPYDVLGVRRGASHDEIRRAYLALARRHHPDRGGDAATMQRINEAWARLAATPPAPRRVWSAPPPDAPEGPDPEVVADLLDDRPRTAPRRSVVDLVPVSLFVAAVATGCLALALDEPALLGVAGFVFFLSCIAVAAIALLAMRRSIHADRNVG